MTFTDSLRSASRRALRFLILSTIVTSGLLFWTRAQAERWLHSEATQFGSTLFELATQGRGLDASPLLHRLEINGLQLEVRTASILGNPEKVSEELVQLAKKHCAVERAGTTSGELTRPFSSLKTGHEGYAYCLKPEAPWTAKRGLQALEQLARNGDLTTLGQLQGIYFRKSKHSVSVLFITQKGPFQPQLLFPSEGDAPGSDFEIIPRPEGRRTFSIARNGITVLNTYSLEGPATQVIQAYLKQLHSTHVTIQVAPKKHSLGKHRALLARVSPSTELLITALEDDTKKSSLVIARLPR